MYLRLLCLASAFYSLLAALADDWPHSHVIWDGLGDPLPSQLAHRTLTTDDLVPNQTFVYPCHLSMTPITEEEDLEARQRAYRLYHWVHDTGEKWPHLDDDSLSAANLAVFYSKYALGRDREALVGRYEECRRAPFGESVEFPLGDPPVDERLRRARLQFDGAYRDLRVAYLLNRYILIIRNSIAQGLQNGCPHIVVRNRDDAQCGIVLAN